MGTEAMTDTTKPDARHVEEPKRVQMFRDVGAHADVLAYIDAMLAANRELAARATDNERRDSYWRDQHAKIDKENHGLRREALRDFDARVAAETRALAAQKDAGRYRGLQKEMDSSPRLAAVVWKRYGKRDGHEWADLVDSKELDATMDDYLAERQSP